MEKRDFPERITVEVTNNCNILCSFCNRNRICMETGYMNDILFKKIIDEASEHLPVKLVPFFRGEPLMHPKILEFIRYAKSKGIGPIQLATNALLLDDEMQDGLIDTGVDYVSFSLDTTDTEVYKKYRQHGNLEISRDNAVKFCEKCKIAAKKGKKVPRTQVSTINIDVYMETQTEFIDFWKHYADVVRVYEQHDEKGRLVDEKLRKKIDCFSERKPCRKVFTDMIVYWNGKLSLCNYDWDEIRYFGDLNNASILDAWNSPEYERIREKHLKGKFEHEICESCNHWKIDYMDRGYLGRSYINGQLEVRESIS